MKLIRFAQGGAQPSFGAVIADDAVSLPVLQKFGGTMAAHRQGPCKSSFEGERL